MVGGTNTTTIKRGDKKDSEEQQRRRTSISVVSAMITDSYRAGRMTIDVLSDDVLIYIFNFYRRGFKYHDLSWPWDVLIHVCQRWRHIIFAWPHHLDVLVNCHSGTHVAKAPHVWPGLPIGIWLTLHHEYGDNIIAAMLKYRDCIARIAFPGLTRSQLERCIALMQRPFPVLRYLLLRCSSIEPPIITDAFLGGSVPHLQRIKLCHIPFPALPKFLSSARDLVELHLKKIPSTGYISPEAMATCLAMLTRLQSVVLRFKSTASFPDQKGHIVPPLTRTILPALARFEFEGICEYLEDILVRFDAPLLNNLTLRFFSQPIFDIPQLLQFVHRTEKFKTLTDAEVHFDHGEVRVYFPRSVDGTLLLEFGEYGLAAQLSLLEQVCTRCFFLSHVNELGLYGGDSPKPDQQNSELWLGFLRPFNAVQILYFFDDEIEIQIARVLGDLTGVRTAEVLPMLHTLVLRGFDQVEPLVTPLLKPFIDARQLWGHPVTVRWELNVEYGCA